MRSAKGRQADRALSQIYSEAKRVRRARNRICPNPFYQIYEGAALLAGAQPYFANSNPSRSSPAIIASISEEIWARTQLLYVCSPGNPTGAVLTLEDWRELFALSDR